MHPKQIMIMLGSVLYFLIIIGITIFPIPMDATSVAAIGAGNTGVQDNWIPFATIARMLQNHSFNTLKNIAGNILMFLPVGFIIPALNLKACRLRHILLVGFLFSAGIELLQLLISLRIHYSYRSTDIDDVILNVIGAILGYCLFLLCRKKIQHNQKFRTRIFKILSMIILIALIMGGTLSFIRYRHSTPQKALASYTSNTLPLKEVSLGNGVFLLSTTDPAKDKQTGYVGWYFEKNWFGYWQLKERVIWTQKQVSMDIENGRKLIWGIDSQNEGKSIFIQYQNQDYNVQVDDRGFWYQVSDS